MKSRHEIGTPVQRSLGTGGFKKLCKKPSDFRYVNQPVKVCFQLYLQLNLNQLPWLRFPRFIVIQLV